MRDWRKYWRSIQPETSLDVDGALRQVGMTVMGKPVEHRCIDVIIESIVAGLQLSRHDVVADLGCGNGLITVRIAKKIEKIVGIDISEGMIVTARANHTRPNCTYCQGDLAKLGRFPIEGVTKAYSYGVLQHLSTKETRAFLGSLVDFMGDDLVFFAGGIPDCARIHAFYNTPERWVYYQRRMAENTEQIGHWWQRDELVALCRVFGLVCTPVDQPSSLYSSHYRFDARIAKR